MKKFLLQKRLEALTGFRKYAAAFGLGAVTTLAMPPAGLFFVMLLTVPGFIWLARNSKTKLETFSVGWAFGAGYFIFGLYWVSVALFVDIQQFWWVLPLSAVVGPVVLALYYGLIPLLGWRYRDDETVYAFMFAGDWALIEWVRGHALTGFPWNLPGQAWQHVLPVMQANAVLGVYGVTLLTLLWAAIPALKKNAGRVALASFLTVALLGLVRVMMHPADEGHVAVRIVQPNIPENLKWSRAEMWKNLNHILTLTGAKASGKMPITYTVWPETALTADLRQSPDFTQRIADKLPVNSVGLLGALRIIDNEHFYNSVTVLDGNNGIVLDNYNKHHLVPFGEYIPFREYLNLTPVAAGISGIGDFTRGSGVHTLHIGDRPRVSPLVCYEAIFPGEVADEKNRPDVLLNVTNDAWYGKTAGPHQHFENVRLRAIEEGVPLVRAANTGISAMIDPLGRVRAQLPLGAEGVVDAPLPAPLPPTIYGKFGDALFFLMLVLWAICGETLRRKA